MQGSPIVRVDRVDFWLVSQQRSYSFDSSAPYRLLKRRKIETTTPCVYVRTAGN